VALIRTDVSEDRIASIFRVHECEQVTERSWKRLYRHRLIGDSQKMIIIIVTAVETSNLTIMISLNFESRCIEDIQSRNNDGN
jgi:hypothetical protein